MPIDERELMKALAIIANERNVRVTVKNTAKGAAICAVTSFVGGILLGPIGLALGGATGGAVAYKSTQGCFQPLGSVLLNDITDRQRDLLAKHISKAVQDFHITDISMLLPLLMTNNAVQDTVFNILLKFVTKEMRLQIVD